MNTGHVVAWFRNIQLLLYVMENEIMGEFELMILKRDGIGIGNEQIVMNIFLR